MFASLDKAVRGIIVGYVRGLERNPHVPADPAAKWGFWSRCRRRRVTIWACHVWFYTEFELTPLNAVAS